MFNRLPLSRRTWNLLGLAFLALLLLAAGDVVTTPSTNYFPIVFRTDAAPPGPAWLTYLNSLRALGGLPAVTENASWSAGDVLHSRYCVKNNTITHTETVGNPWYTVEGAAAGQNGNVMVSSNVNTPDTSALDGWMTGPFHGVGMIDPALLQAGFGSYAEAIGTWQYAATLDVLRGRGSIPGSVSFPVRWPGNGTTMPYTDFDGSEWPNPLSSCSGYTAPSGPPIYLLLSPGTSSPNVTAHSFSQGATLLQSCVFDWTTYTNTSSSDQSLVRSILNGRKAIILMPRSPLNPGAAYTVSITANGTAHTWSFTVAALSAPEMPAGRRQIR